MSRALLPIVPPAVALLFAAAAAVSDLRTRRIPNRLVLLCIPAAVLTRFVCLGWRGVAGTAAAAAVALVLMSLGFLLGGIGAGDVKLMAAMGAFAGLSLLPLLLMVTALAGGVFGLLALGRNAWAKRSFRHVPSIDGAAFSPLTLPYAVPIACGMLAVFCHVLRNLA